MFLSIKLYQISCADALEKRSGFVEKHSLLQSCEDVDCCYSEMACARPLLDITIRLNAFWMSKLMLTDKFLSLERKRELHVRNTRRIFFNVRYLKLGVKYNLQLSHTLMKIMNQELYMSLYTYKSTPDDKLQEQSLTLSELTSELFPSLHSVSYMISRASWNHNFALP